MAYEIYEARWEKDRSVKGVLFDMDGLVLDTEGLYCRFWAEAARALGYPMTREQALGMRALSAAAGQEKLESYFGPGVSHHDIRQVRIRLMDAYIEEHGIQPKPGIRELLAYLKDRRIPAALATSSPMDRIQAYMGPLGLLDQFQAICSGYEVPHGKPAPDIFLHAARAIGQDPIHCMVLEDSPSGILAASRADCLPVMIPDQDQPSAETAALLSGKADSLLDIMALLDRVNSGR